MSDVNAVVVMVYAGMNAIPGFQLVDEGVSIYDFLTRQIVIVVLG